MLWKEQLIRLRKKPLELLLLSVIFAVIVFTSMTITPMLRRLNAPVDEFLDNQRVESFHVSLGMIDFHHLRGAQRLDVYQTMNLHQTFPALDEQDPYQMNAINQYIQHHIYAYPELIERIYDSIIEPFTDEALELERSYRLELEDGAYYYQILTVNKTINIPYFTEGGAPQGNQIALFKPFADANNLKVGDTHQIGHDTFEISGLFYDPQFILPALRTTSLNYNPDFESYVLVDFETFLAFEKPFRVYVHGIGDFGALGSDFDVYQILQSDLQRLGRNMRMVETVVPQDYNIRIQALSVESRLTSIFVTSFASLFYLVALVLVAYKIHSHLLNQKQTLLTLHALGYSRFTLAKSQLILVGFFSGLLLVVGGLGIGASAYFYRFYTARYFYPHIAFRVDFVTIVFGLLVPILLIFLVTFWYSYHVIRSFPKEKSMTISRMRLIKIRNFVLRGSLFVVVGVLFLFSRFASTLIDDFQEHTMEGKHFEQMVFLKHFTNQIDTSHEPFAYSSLELQAINNRTITTRTYVQGYGIPYNTTLLRFDESQDRQNSLFENGVLVSQHFANSYNVSIGDELLLGFGREQVRLTVTAITSELLESAVYMNHETLNVLQGYTDTPMYNGYFTSNIIEDDDDVFRIVHYQVIIDEINHLFALTNRIIYGLMVVSVVVALMMFHYLVSSALNAVLMSYLTLKALGYREDEMYRMFFRENVFILAGSYLVATLVAIGMIRLVIVSLSDTFGFVFIFNLRYETLIIGFMMMIFLIGVVSYISHLSIKKIPLSTVLKKV